MREQQQNRVTFWNSHENLFFLCLAFKLSNERLICRLPALSSVCSITHSHQPATRHCREKSVHYYVMIDEKAASALCSSAITIKICLENHQICASKLSMVCARVSRPPKWKSILLLIYLFRFMLCFSRSFCVCEDGSSNQHRRARPKHEKKDVPRMISINEHIYSLFFYFMEKKYFKDTQKNIFSRSPSVVRHLVVVVVVLKSILDEEDEDDVRQSHEGGGLTARGSIIFFVCCLT